MNQTPQSRAAQMDKHLILINGTMGVGKTATCEALMQMLPSCAFLDGDWCWRMHPFTVTDETKRMVMDNIVFLLQRFLACSQFKNVLFCWVMHEQSILDEILSRLRLEGVSVHTFTLTASEKAIRERIKGDVGRGIRSEGVLRRSMERLPLYHDLATVKIDTSVITPEQAARQITLLL